MTSAASRKAAQQRAAQALQRSVTRTVDLDYLRHAATARGSRVGPGPDRPAVHSYAEARREYRQARADFMVLQASSP